MGIMDIRLIGVAHSVGVLIPTRSATVNKGKNRVKARKAGTCICAAPAMQLAHHIQALDGEVGHVEDFVIDDETWAIRYIIVDTHNWWPGKKVLVATQWVERVSWDERKVFVNLNRQTIKESPEYTKESLLTRDYEAQLYKHYDRKGYWVDELVAG